MLQDLVAQGARYLRVADTAACGGATRGRRGSRGGWLEALTSRWVLEFRGVGGADCAAALSRDQRAPMIKRAVTVSITVVGLAAVLAAPGGALVVSPVVRRG